MSLQHTVNIDLADRSYPIYIGDQLLGDSSLWIDHIHSRQVMIVSNSTIMPLYAEKLNNAFLTKDVAYCELPDGEQYKDWQTLNLIFDALLKNQFDRGACIVALGGGVVGDMAGFAAACYQRGIDFIQIPTTLLALVDSSVGGKTAVNHPRGKNMIGAFHQPQCVVADLDTLQTLPQREFIAGLAEVIKYGLITDLAFFTWLENNMESLLQRDPQALSHAIKRSCEVKAEIVSKDEREGGVRALLNLGHTFGHAIESGLGYGEWLHGEAVGLGMLMACQMSVNMGLVKHSELERVKQLLTKTGLPLTMPSNLSSETLRTLMQHDKKVKDARVRLILMQGIGDAFLTADYEDNQLQACLDSFINQ